MNISQTNIATWSDFCEDQTDSGRFQYREKLVRDSLQYITTPGLRYQIEQNTERLKDLPKGAQREHRMKLREIHREELKRREGATGTTAGGSHNRTEGSQKQQGQTASSKEGQKR